MYLHSHLFHSSKRFIPESCRWLLVNGKEEEALEQIRKVAKFNGKEMPEEVLSLKDGVAAKRLGDIRDLFSSIKMTSRTLISWFAW